MFVPPDVAWHNKATCVEQRKQHGVFVLDLII